MSIEDADLEDVIIWLAVGIVAGWLASKIMGSRRGVISYAVIY